MARYTDDSKQRVKDAVDMLDLVGTRVELRRAGSGTYMGICPFHDERSPSLSVDPSQKLYHCFGCSAGGDAIRFVQEIEGLEFTSALEWLADRYNVQLEQESEDPRAAADRKSRERLMELLDRTATFYARYLWEHDEAAPAREYLASRGLEEMSLREFRVGYAPSRYDVVLNASRRGGFSNREVYDAGLAQRSQSNGQLMDRFRRRIVFPLCDRRGRVLGFGARALGADQQPKYLNSSDNSVYHKGEHLFGADIARAHATKAGSVILCEGYTDVIALHQAGLKQTVGLMGTALTEKQVAELARLAPVVQLALDADSAGQEAMIRAARVASARRIELRVVPLPAGQDPADLVAAAGPEAIRAVVAESVPFVRFQVERELARGDLSSAEGKDHVIDALAPIFKTIPPSALREELLRYVVGELDLQHSLVSGWLEERGRRVSAPARSDGRSGAQASRGSGGEGRGSAPSDAAATGEAYGWTPSGADDPGPSRAAPRVPESPLSKHERDFLAQCACTGEPAREALTVWSADPGFTVPVNSRAASHLLAHLDAPGEELPPDDPELAALLADLAIRAGQLRPLTADVEVERGKLELTHLDRAIAAARRSGAAGIADLVRHRETLRAELDAALEV